MHFWTFKLKKKNRSTIFFFVFFFLPGRSNPNDLQRFFSKRSVVPRNANTTPKIRSASEMPKVSRSFVFFRFRNVTVCFPRAPRGYFLRASYCSGWGFFFFIVVIIFDPCRPDFGPSTRRGHSIVDVGMRFDPLPRRAMRLRGCLVRCVRTDGRIRLYVTVQNVGGRAGQRRKNLDKRSTTTGR